MKPKILVIEDESQWSNLLARKLKDLYELLIADTGEKGLKILEENEPNCIILDLELPDYKDEEDLPLLKILLDRYPQISLIVFTAHDDPSLAVRATRLGAFDYFSKRLLNIDKLQTTIRNAISLQRSYKDKINGELASYPLIGKSLSIIKLKIVINKVALSDVPILIIGESGTGKENVAHHLHYKSDRFKNKFEVVSLQGLNEDMARSELFGHVKGSFTDAKEDKEGKFDFANEGTIFLDDVDLCPFRVQGMLLRVLDGHAFQPVGSNDDHNVNVRIIASSNKDLRQLAETGEFRQDLYSRLAGITIEIPPLRERIEDIEILADLFLENEIRYGDKKPQRFSDRAYSMLREYNWPLNVRELKHVVKAMHVLIDSDIIEAEDVREYLQLTLNDDNKADSLKAAVYNFKREFIYKKLTDNDYNISRTAENIGIARQHLQNLIKSLKIDKP